MPNSTRILDTILGFVIIKEELKKGKVMGKLKKVFGSVGKLISIIPDTTELIGKTIENTRPIIEKELDRRHTYKNSLVRLDNVIHLNIDEAKEFLEHKGFKVVTVLAQPSTKYIDYERHQVVKMVPTSGKYTENTLVKLYYINDTILAKSHDLSLEKQIKKQEQQDKLAQLLKKPSFSFKRKKSTEYDDEVIPERPDE